MNEYVNKPDEYIKAPEIEDTIQTQDLGSMIKNFGNGLKGCVKHILNKQALEVEEQECYTKSLKYGMSGSVSCVTSMLTMAYLSDVFTNYDMGLDPVIGGAFLLGSMALLIFGMFSSLLGVAFSGMASDARSQLKAYYTPNV